MTARHWPLVLLLVLLQCASLPEVPLGTCGNRALEAGEDCDTFAPEGMYCRSGSVENACRYGCNGTTGSPRCPTGWGCGNDGVCRSPSGRLIATSSRIDQTAATLDFADFDGDGVPDLLVTSGAGQGAGPRVLFLDALGKSQSLRTIQNTVTSPRAVVLDGSVRASMVVAATTPGFSSRLSGVATLVGTTARDFLALPYDAVAALGGQARLVAVHGARDNANGIAPLLLLSTDGTTGIFTDAMSASGSRVGVLPLGLDALVGELLVANVIDATSPCDELVYATTSTVAVLEPCDAQGHLVQSASPSTVLTVSSVLTTLAVVDINADGHMDLLFALSSTPYVAFGGGDGHFYEDPSATGALGFLTLALDSRAPGASTGPIGESMQPVFAAGVVDSSGRVALLTESQVLLSSGGRRVTGTYQLQANALVRRLSGTWTSARIDDINRDGHADLLLGSSFADVDLLLGTGSGVFTRMKVSTHAPVSHIATADIDGDGVRDTIVVEDDIDGTGSTLRVAYGNPLTGPQALTTVAQVKSIKQVVGIALDSQSPAEAVAIVSGGTAGSDQLTVLTSEGARTPISPVSLVTSPSTVEGQALVLAVGRFLDRQRQDAVVVAIDSNAQGTMGPPQARLWTVTSLSTRGHEVFASEALAGISVVTPGGGVTVSLLAADANGDGLDELYMLTVDTSGRTTLLAASSSNGGGVGPTEILLLPTFIAAGADSSLLALDVDRDGLRDLVVLCRGADGSSELLVLWNDGGFSTSMVSEVATDSPLLAMGTLVLDGAWGAEVVVSTEKALHVLRSGGTPRQLVLAAVEGSGGGTALATADINGDGLLDVAIGAASGITVYFGEATQP